MLRYVYVAFAAAFTLVTSSTVAHSQSGTNVGSLACNFASGVGFVVGSFKELVSLLSRADGNVERDVESIKKFGIDIAGLLA